MAYRLPDWRDRLHTFLAANAATPFQPGFFDCSLMTGAGIGAMTGTDPAAPYRGNYSTIEEGLALLQADGFEDHVAFAASMFDEIPVLAATEGDVAVVRQGNLTGLGIVLGSTIAVASEKGIVQLPLTAASQVFEVPA
nr:hypothetical protein [uncultured Defluviimonas sp.]